MKFGSHLNYDEIMSRPSQDIAQILGEIKRIIDFRIQYELNKINEDIFSANSEVIDRSFLLHKYRQEIYINTVNLLAEELNTLGHQLIPIDQDINIDFESSSVSWIAMDKNEGRHGLDIEFFPNKTNVLWILSAN